MSSSASHGALLALKERRFALEIRLQRLSSEEKTLQEAKDAARDTFKAAADACQAKLLQIQQCEDQLRALEGVIVACEEGEATGDIGEKRART